MLGKFELHRFFHGLKISEKNINKSSNDLQGVVITYAVIQFF